MHKDENNISSSLTLNFTPLTLNDDGTYTCTVTITSPLLNNTRTAMRGRILAIIRKLHVYRVSCVTHNAVYSFSGGCDHW